MKYQEYNVERRVKLDEKDKAILKLLNEDCRMSLTQISRKTRIPIDTVKYRIEKMEREGVFEYTIVMDPLKIGYPIFDALYVNLVNFTTDEEDRLMKYTMKNKNIAYSSKTLGKYDFIIGIVAKDIHELQRVIQDFKTEFQNIIKEIDALSIIEEYKYDYLIDLI